MAVSPSLIRECGRGQDDMEHQTTGGGMAEPREGDVSRGVGIHRRDLIRRGAIVGGTLLWATPVIQSFARPALAHAVSPASHYCCHCYNSDGILSTVTGTTGYCMSDGDILGDVQELTREAFVGMCVELGFDQVDFHQGPNPFGCNPVHPSVGGGCSAH